MKETRILMGMPITVELCGVVSPTSIIEKVFAYFSSVDEKFSTYKKESEISKINRGEIDLEGASKDMREIFALAERTKAETEGYFDIRAPEGYYDPSGIVKGWAIKRAAQLIEREHCENFCVEAGGDIQTHGVNKTGERWQVGIRNPFNIREIVKVLSVSGEGVATSGTYLRGQHIYDPHKQRHPITDIVSITVVGRDIYEADRFATAAFAMGESGIRFIERLPGFEGYMIDVKGTGTMTSGFDRFLQERSCEGREILTRGPYQYA